MNVPPEPPTQPDHNLRWESNGVLYEWSWERSQWEQVHVPLVVPTVEQQLRDLIVDLCKKQEKTNETLGLILANVQRIP